MKIWRFPICSRFPWNPLGAVRSLDLAPCVIRWICAASKLRIYIHSNIIPVWIRYREICPSICAVGISDMGIATFAVYSRFPLFSFFSIVPIPGNGVFQRLAVVGIGGDLPGPQIVSRLCLRRIWHPLPFWRLHTRAANLVCNLGRFYTDNLIF